MKLKTVADYHCKSECLEWETSNKKNLKLFLKQNYFHLNLIELWDQQHPSDDLKFTAIAHWYGNDDNDVAKCTLKENYVIIYCNRFV